MKRIRRIIFGVVALTVFMFTVLAYQYTATVFSGLKVYAGGVTVTQTSNTGAIYHLYCTSTKDHSQITFSTSGKKTVTPRTASNQGKSHYMQVEYGTKPIFTYTINK